MYKRYSKIFILLALASVFATRVAADDTDSYANLNKTATFDYETQTGEITLESYVTGIMKVTQEAKPIEVVMLLDYSSSMGESYTSSDSYMQYTATKRYYAGNTKVGSDYVSSMTDEPKGGKLKDSGDNSDIKVDYNGSAHQVYVIKVGSSSTKRYWCYIEDGGKRVFLRADGSFVKENNTVASAIETNKAASWPKDQNGNTIFPAQSDDRIFFCRMGTTSKTITSRTDALRSAAYDFIDNVYKHAHDNNVTDRISIVQFQGNGETGNKYQSIYQYGTSYDDGYTNPSSPMYLNEFPTDKNGSGSLDGSLQGKTFVAKRFTDVLSDHACDYLKFAIGDIDAKGSTNVADGLTIVSLLINSFARTDSNIAKILIIFSDGDPTDDKNTSIAKAKALKDAGWKVYTVYCNTKDAKDTQFMNYLSSNYPDATSTSKPGTKTTEDVEYYKTAKQDLGSVFATLTNEVTAMAGTQYGTETLLKDFVNNTYFKMPDNITSYDVKIYEQACTGVTTTDGVTTYTFNDVCIDSGTGANRLWHNGSTQNPKSPIHITINRNGVGGYTGQDQVLISGYDYSHADNWCGLRKSSSNPAGTPGGHRLIVKFPYEIKIQEGQTATGALKTNGDESGIYEAKEDENGKKPGDEGYEPTYDKEPETPYPMPVVYFASLNITRTSLDKGESAIYDIYQTLAGESIEKKVGRLSINGSGSGSDSKIMYGLAGGVGVKYRVQETDWNWAYHTTGTMPEKSETIQQKSTDEPTVPSTSNLYFNFDGDHREPASGEEANSPFSMFNHDEEYKVNTMDIQ